MVAYHYPPVQGSSGIQRTLKFAGYLPEFGWQPIVPRKQGLAKMIEFYRVSLRKK